MADPASGRLHFNCKNATFLHVATVPVDPVGKGIVRKCAFSAPFVNPTGRVGYILTLVFFSVGWNG